MKTAHVMLKGLLIETGHGLSIVVSKWLGDRLIEVKYNKTSQSGFVKGDRVCLAN